jgi:hypothetical protein
MIIDCINHELEVNFTDRSYICEVLYHGLKGYDNMTDAEIKEYWDSFQEQ